MTFPPIKEQLDLIINNTVEVISEEELEKKLDKSIKTGKPLKVKLGADPSRPDLHLGHSVVLRKLRDFQDLGHEAILIIGDFTAMIGDPSGKSKTRPQLSAQEARENGETYFEQASKILDPEKTTICYNSEWLGKMTFSDVIRLSSHYTVARMLERDDFERRYQSCEPISIHEFLYPLAQGMDSVHLKNDIELGGTDQKFNLLVGRDLQREYHIDPQVCITMPLLVGTFGDEKMSKSLGNAISFTDSAQDVYGKTLSIPDSLIETWFKLLVPQPRQSIKLFMEIIRQNPREAKRTLARELVALYHCDTDAVKAEEHFDRVFVQKKAPENIEVFTFRSSTMQLVELLGELQAVGSKSEARRLIQQNAIQIDDEKISSIDYEVELNDTPKIIKAGKRKFFKVMQKKDFE
ncbi:tyrosine--tRNA ligase [Prosthecochloris sp. ZM]|uniref:Tyrosine--tRNA ligase n=1 Tax=Prosthecochloris aestuarii (strain DSM 271 / SK 413) TaxID=290512 RepID=B4S6J8_PROA2|nr:MULTISPECIES: tyrosine--tRNA ligase [Prosthecochloris]ACF45753.1 tyrosyl-tRNA synthetase [Prosthecochloris aestuarii DSM 271]NEX12131.1 tyrosine--tRNA ligase [Prosthecochloris sp.]RDD30729.1 tyrosine--tRNA ligase [Prosthecochloris sp. ZM]